MRPTNVANNAANAAVASNMQHLAVAHVTGSLRSAQVPPQGQAIYDARRQLVSQAFMHRRQAAGNWPHVVRMNEYGERLVPTNITLFSSVVEGSFAARHGARIRMVQCISNFVLSIASGCLTVMAVSSDPASELLCGLGAPLAACAVNTAAMTFVIRYGLGGRFDSGVPVFQEESSVRAQPEASAVNEDCLTRLTEALPDIEAQTP
jgi:hypothetical protein